MTKIEDLIPRGFQLVSYANVNNGVTSVVLCFASDKAIKDANNAAFQFSLKNQDVLPEQLDRVKIAALKPLISQEFEFPVVVSPEHERATLNSFKVYFLSKFLQEQFELIVKASKEKEDGLPTIPSSDEGEENKDSQGTDDKVRKISK